MDTHKQVGGTHYAVMAVQPITYILANKLDYCQGNIVKYVTRHKGKNGREDLEKAEQYVTFLIDYYKVHRFERCVRWVAAHPWIMRLRLHTLPSEYTKANDMAGLWAELISAATEWRTMGDLYLLRSALAIYKEQEYRT